jgi:hypothetical protein
MKFCVFCGKKPEEKTKEHVIPLWLIKLTGNPNREVHLGIGSKIVSGKREFELRKYAFSSFQFPACKTCNEKFSALEDKVKEIIEKILNKDFLSNQQISILLDWFDKVRTGIWLGGILLDKEFANVKPNFHIKDRIGEKDRCLIVYEMNDDWQGLQFFGTNLPIFSIFPSCFSLGINNYYFLNISTDFLFSMNIGFPFTEKRSFRNQDNRTIMAMNNGLSRIKLPLFRFRYEKPSIEVFQPMIHKKLLLNHEETNDLYNCDYIKSNCLDYSKGIGSIFYIEGKRLLKLDDDYEICLSNSNIKYDREKFIKVHSRQILDIQYFMSKDIPSVDNLPPERRKHAKLDFNNTIKVQKAYRKLI